MMKETLNRAFALGCLCARTSVCLQIALAGIQWRSYFYGGGNAPGTAPVKWWLQCRGRSPLVEVNSVSGVRPTCPPLHPYGSKMAWWGHGRGDTGWGNDTGAENWPDLQLQGRPLLLCRCAFSPNREAVIAVKWSCSGANKWVGVFWQGLGAE